VKKAAKKKRVKSLIPPDLRKQADAAIDVAIEGLKGLKGKSSHVTAECSRPPRYAGDENGCATYEPGPITYIRLTLHHQIT